MEFNLIDKHAIVQHALWRVPFALVDKNGNPVSLVGASATMVIRYELEGAAVVTLTSSPAAGLVINGAAGTITATIDDAVTGTMTVGRFVYAVQVTYTAGEPIEEIRGYGHIRRGVIRP
jgi:hypothetical protein